MLKRRVVSCILIGGAFLVAASFVPTIGAWVLMILLSSLAQVEFYRMMNTAAIPVFKIVGLLCGAALISATFLTVGLDSGWAGHAYDWEYVVLLLCPLVVFVRQFPQKHNDKPIETIACTLLGVWYVPFLFNFITRLAFCWEGSEGLLGGVGRTGRILVLYLVVVVKLADVGAFVFGSWLGRHKLFPRISPAKTWEGLVGGMFLAVVASFVFARIAGYSLGMVSVSAVHAIVLGLLLGLAGMIGDMCESLIKRASGAKDSGAIVPGMGGILDVLDSLLFGAPVLYAYACLFL